MTSLEVFCQFCGARGGTLLRCSACKEVHYCSSDHQRSHWKAHKAICTYVQAKPACVVVEVEAGEGNGLCNRMTNRMFESKAKGLSYIQLQFPLGASYPLRSPFAELMGWSMEIYCSKADNFVSEHGVTGNGRSTLNGAGIYLGSAFPSGMTMYNNMSGRIFVLGRRSDGKPLVSDSLWGILDFIWDAMDLFGEDEDPLPIIRRWAKNYQQRTWQPGGGSGGIDVYVAEVDQCQL